MYKKVFFSIIISLSFTSCSLQEHNMKNETHKEQGPHLKVFMRDINTIVANNQQSELERDDERRRNALNLVDALKQFSSKVQNKQVKFQTKYITDDNSAFFYTQIQKLDAKVQEIETIANNYEMKKLDKKIVELKSICASCHRELKVKYVQNLF